MRSKKTEGEKNVQLCSLPQSRLCRASSLPEGTFGWFRLLRLLYSHRLLHFITPYRRGVGDAAPYALSFTLHYSLFTIHEKPPLRGIRVFCRVGFADTRGRVSLRCMSFRFPFIGNAFIHSGRFGTDKSVPYDIVVSFCVFASGAANRCV